MQRAHAQHHVLPISLRAGCWLAIAAGMPSPNGLVDSGSSSGAGAAHRLPNIAMYQHGSDFENALNCRGCCFSCFFTQTVGQIFESKKYVPPRYSLCARHSALLRIN